MLRLMLAAVIAAFLASCSMSSTGPTGNAGIGNPAAAARADLAPSGKLRAAINFGNPVLAVKDPATGKVTEALKSGAWDVAFLAIDPVRAAEISYSPPYVVIEGRYLVPRDSLIRSNADVDRPGVRIAVATGSVYDLYLSRELKQATLVRTPVSGEVADNFVAQELEVRAGVKQQLEDDVRRIPGLRLLEGRFMVINQAMGTPRGRDAGTRYLRDFIETMKSSGFVAGSLARHHVEGAAIAPPGDAR
jgi:polar amino acid transport system substrate-binding protein